MTKEHDKNKKSNTISVGLALTVFALFLLISGICKLAFLGMKNHRSAVSREPFVQAFVDIQPFNEEIKGNSHTVVYHDKNSSAPGIVFKKDRPQLANAGKNDDIIVKRPPVLIQQASITPVAPVLVEEKSPFVDIDSDEIVDADTTPLPLDDMMASAKSLLDTSDKQATQTAMMLNEDEQKTALIPTPETKNVDQPEITVARASINKSVEKFVKNGYNPYKGKFITKNDILPKNKTWLDEDALRRQIAAEENQKFLANETATAAVEMQTTDTVENKVKSAEKTEPQAVEQKNAEQKQVVSEQTVASQQETPTFKPAEEVAQVKEENKKKAEAKKSSSPFLTPEEIQKLREAPNPDSPWIIAKAGGKTAKNLAVKPNELKKVEPEQPVQRVQNLNEKEVVLTELSENAEKTEATSSEIYRYDRKIEGKEKSSTDSKSLNWMDREQAAVWTSLSQTDSPSVWNKNEKTENTESVKAFRVADELPAEEPAKTEAKEDSKKNAEPNEVSSKPAIVIEDKKPEGIKNPTLLPLPDNSAKGLPAPVTTAPVGQTNAVPAIGLAQVPTAETVKENDKGVDKSLVNKIFSIFKSDDGQKTPTAQGTASSATTAKKEAQMPTIGKGNALKPTEAQTTKIIEKQIMPSEIRLTFKPDSTEISAQSVKWIKSFGQSVKSDIQKAIEVRMSSTSPALQEKRFAIIRSILTGVGVEDVQIVPLLTDRTPHTIVLRTYQIPDEEVAEYTTSTDGIKASLYYKKW